MIRRIILAALAMLLLSGTGAVQAQEGTERPWCVSVWYPSSDQPGGMDSILNNLDVIDEVNPFWYSANSDGTLGLLPGAEDADELAAWRVAGLHVIPTIANASYLAIGPDIRAAHIQAIVDLVEQWDYEGIDIDYESFPLSTRDDFSTFIEELAVQLHDRRRLLSIAVHAKTDDPGTWEGPAAQDWTRLAPAVDIFRLMTYDYHSRSSKEPGPIGPPLWSQDVLAYAASLTDLGKVRLGVHFYGYVWQRGRVTTTSWASVQRSVESFKLPIERDPADMEARIDIKVTGLPAQTVYVADAEGIAYKLDLLRAAYPELGGLAIWGLSGEDPANWEVLRAYSAAECNMQ
jgi:hypothetical protein